MMITSLAMTKLNCDTCLSDGGNLMQFMIILFKITSKIKNDVTERCDSALPR